MSWVASGGGGKKRVSLNFIKDRVWEKIQGWKEKLLSQASKEILLKFIVQVIPTIAISCFRLPVGLCKDIEEMMRKFWWGQQRDYVNQKNEGGMVFKDFCRFNEAMLTK